MKLILTIQKAQGGTYRSIYNIIGGKWEERLISSHRTVAIVTVMFSKSA